MKTPGRTFMRSGCIVRVAVPTGESELAMLESLSGKKPTSSQWVQNKTSSLCDTMQKRLVEPQTPYHLPRQQERDHQGRLNLCERGITTTPSALNPKP